MKIELRNPEASASDAPRPQPDKRPSLFRRALRRTAWLAAGPIDWFGAPRIRRSWSFIGDLIGILRAGPAKDGRFKTTEDGMFDLRASAFSYGMSVPQFEALLRARRLQTARIAYVTFALGCLFLFAWIWQALATPMLASRVFSALYFLPFCGLFFLYSSYQALLNFQLRTCRAASWREYLATSERFWPC